MWLMWGAIVALIPVTIALGLVVSTRQSHPRPIAGDAAALGSRQSQPAATSPTGTADDPSPSGTASHSSDLCGQVSTAPLTDLMPTREGQNQSVAHYHENQTTTICSIDLTKTGGLTGTLTVTQTVNPSAADAKALYDSTATMDRQRDPTITQVPGLGSAAYAWSDPRTGEFWVRTYEANLDLFIAWHNFVGAPPNADDFLKRLVTVCRNTLVELTR